MRKEKSWTRQDYESQYEYIRRGCDVDYLLSEYPDQEEAIKAADYSYQAMDHGFSGWLNRRHRDAFWNRYHEICLGGRIPF